MEQYVQVLMGLLKSRVTGAPADIAGFSALSEQEQQKLGALSRSHSVSQLVGDALGGSLGALPTVAPLVQDTLGALGRTEVMEYDRQQITGVLKQAGIPFIQLKGARIRGYYPEPWMRSSGDIDILVHEQDAERAAGLLEQQLQCTRGARCYHDILLTTPEGVELELHFSLRINVPDIDRLLARVWEQSRPVQDSCEYVQTPEFFIFHVVAHMVHHFLSGGFGIRFLLDYFLLQQKLRWDDRAVSELCREAGIETFRQNMQQLVQVWFRDGSYTPQAQRMEAYILEGGIFGSRENGIAVQQNQHDSRFYYLLRRVFPKTAYMRATYPELRDRPYLLPVCHVRRWASEYRQRRLRMVSSVLHMTRDMDPETVAAVRQLLADNDMLP